MKRVMSQHWFRQLITRLFVDFILCILIALWVSSYREVKATPEIIKTMEIESPAYLTDADFSKLYSCKEDVRNDTCLDISYEDAQRLMKIAVVEDYTDAKSQAYVMEVVLNRVASPIFPDNIKDVIEQEGQFSTVSNGSYQNAVPDVNSHIALAMVEGKKITTDALYFEADWAEGTWQSKHLTYLGKVGNTRFYK